MVYHGRGGTQEAIGRCECQKKRGGGNQEKDLQESGDDVVAVEVDVEGIGVVMVCLGNPSCSAVDLTSGK